MKKPERENNTGMHTQTATAVRHHLPVIVAGVIVAIIPAVLRSPSLVHPDGKA
ncbi:MAG: hypothetical protein AAFR90_00365 [Pseudomonadota bacterium]